MSNIYRVIEVLRLVDKGLSLSKMSKKMNLSKSRMSEILKKLEKEGFIESVSRYPRIYRLTLKGRSIIKIRDVRSFSMGRSGDEDFLRLSSEFENLRVKFRVLGFRGGWRGFLEGGRVSGLRNVGQTILDGPDGCKVYVNFGDYPSVVIVFSRVRFDRYNFLGEAFTWYRKSINKVVSWLLRNGVIVDPESEEIIGQEIEFKVPEEWDKHIEQDKLRMYLGRKAVSFVGQTRLDAYVEYNRSGGQGQISTDDLLYAEKFVLMPEIVYDLKKRIIPVLNDFSRNIELHLKVEEKTLETLEKLGNYIQELRDLQRRPGIWSRLKHFLFKWLRRLR